MAKNIENLNYKSILNLYETQIAIKEVKDWFQKEFTEKLTLQRVTAPMFVTKSSGLNDNLNGVEQPVNFHVAYLDDEIEIVHSLAKWKRMALGKYNFNVHTGLYTDMNAIRKDENVDFYHSIYVDQWDYEIAINKEDRELENRYPNLNRKEREDAIAREYKAIFLYQIGWPLKDNLPHDGRAADYDDWQLNGDIILYYSLYDMAFEISSMGIRVDKESLVKQLEYKNETYKLSNPFCQDILNDKIPLSIGGGIGQSRLCMFMLQKAHIGEVQVSLWPKKELEKLEKLKIFLL